jgi:membrane-anchored glycerophosphoryl diester phosphodiesterase (GDPDase)
LLFGVVVAVLPVLAGVAVGVASSSAGAGVAVGAFVLLVEFFPMIFVAIRLSMAFTILVAERLGPIDAVRRSWQVTRDSFWRIFGIGLLTSLLASVVAGIITFPFTMLGSGFAYVTASSGIAALIGSSALAVLGAALSTLVAVPFEISVNSLLYVDLRMRREGFDVELMAASATLPTA